MPDEAKTLQLNVKINPSLKDRLTKYSDEKHWTMSQAARIILDEKLPKYEPSDIVG